MKDFLDSGVESDREVFFNLVFFSARVGKRGWGAGEKRMVYFSSSIPFSLSISDLVTLPLFLF